ncbi:hypothetical protein CLERM_008 [Coxiella-like endosymbiont]|nr:hypothetical protein CLERM_008 [Coxiella-like endosymbiont]
MLFGDIKALFIQKIYFITSSNITLSNLLERWITTRGIFSAITHD